MKRQACRFVSFWLAIGLAVVLAASVEAGVVVSNLSESNDGYGYGVNVSLFWANSFTTDGSAYQFNSAAISIRSVEDASGAFQISLWNGATAPGSELAVLSGPANPGVGLNSYTGASLALTANTRYWLVAKVTSGNGAYQWNTTTSLNQTGNWEIGNQPYQYMDLEGFRIWTAVDDPYQFSIDATAVPEPAAASAVAAAGLMLFTALRARLRPLRRGALLGGD